MGPVYPGTCSNRTEPYQREAIRVRTQGAVVEFNDHHYGLQVCDLEKTSGDYVIYRADGMPSYILAVTIDDIFERYSEIVRGSDLLAITPRQIHLSLLVKKCHPCFFHVPVITDHNGNKLSKQTYAPALKKHHARNNLFFALQDLGQSPPRPLIWRPLTSIWEWAFSNWKPELIPQDLSIRFNH